MRWWHSLRAFCCRCSSRNDSDWVIWVSSAVVVLLLSGCGFQLAERPLLPASLQRIALEAEDQRSQLYIELHKALVAQGVIIDRTAPVRLELVGVSTGQRVLSVSARNVPREFEVFYTGGFILRDGATVLLQSDRLTFTRDYNWSEFEVLGKVQEEDNLRQLLVDDLVDAILRQLSSVS